MFSIIPNSRFLIVLLLVGCSPKITTSINNNLSPLPYQQPILVLPSNEEIPEDAIFIGSIKIGDSGFTTKCSYLEVIELAKLEARKAGGNIVKITEHKPPSMGSTCHRISASILKSSDENILMADMQAPTEVLEKDADYALLHVYRNSGVGPLVSYDLHLGDSVICRVKNNFRQSIKIKKEGYYSLWARTESKVEVPIHLETGKVYYLRCGVKLGMLVGRPSLQLIDTPIGKAEFDF